MEPSSTTMISKSEYVSSMMESRHFFKYFSVLKTGIMTETLPRKSLEYVCSMIFWVPKTSLS